MDRDVVVECSGTPEGLEIALELVRPRGTIVLKSTYGGRPRFDFSQSVVVPEITLRGSRCGPFLPALELLRKGAINTEGMVEAEYPLEQWEKAFEQAFSPGTLKVLFRVTT